MDYASVSRLGVMNFLSAIEYDYPSAVSFASGRPTEAFFDVDGWFDAMTDFRRRDAQAAGVDVQGVSRRLAQYGRTNGMINALVADQLANDEGIVCEPERIVVTNGCQEALALCLQALCTDARDVALARNPTYIGVTGAAELSGIALEPIRHGEHGLLADVHATVAALEGAGKRAKVLYLIPEFDNPTGDVLSTAEREALLAFCAERRIAILEDNPYGMFRFEGSPTPPISALDRAGVAIYLGTYSKTLCPAVRVGCAVVPRTLFGSKPDADQLLASLGERKSFATVNTSQFNQALVGGVLLNEAGTLRRLVRPSLEFYRRNRDALLERLDQRLGDAPVRWNRPAGGFFLSLELPFAFEAADMVACAEGYGAIAMPMSFFALDDSQRYRVRLAFSNLDVDRLTEGVDRFARFVRSRLETPALAACSA